jgi:hypothetical protein
MTVRGLRSAAVLVSPYGLPVMTDRWQWVGSSFDNLRGTAAKCPHCKFSTNGFQDIWILYAKRNWIKRNKSQHYDDLQKISCHQTRAICVEPVWQTRALTPWVFSRQGWRSAATWRQLWGVVESDTTPGLKRTFCLLYSQVEKHQRQGYFKNSSFVPAQWPYGLRREPWSTGCWDRAFEFRLRQECLSLFIYHHSLFTLS